MSNVFERLYNSPTKASIGQRASKYDYPDKDRTEWKRPTARPSSPTTPPVFQNASPKKSTVSVAVPPPVEDIHVPPYEECMVIFDSIDMNRNGVLSLAELDKAVVEIWPDFNNKPAIMRAYKASDGDSNGYVERNEFMSFLKFISYYNNLWHVFESTDQDGDRRITRQEFTVVAPKLGISNADTFFAEMDANNGGVVLFDEFCAHMAKQGSVPKESKAPPSRATPKAKAKPKQKSPTKKKADPAPPPVPQAAVNIEVPPQDECMSLFDRIDYNGNGILSLAELDKAVVELWPDFDNKPAIMRAYKASDRDGNGFVKRDEFVFFLKYISYFNNLWDLFGATDADGDRRLTKEEFKAIAPKLNIKNAQDLFEEMDTNHGGVVLFDEFCARMARESSIPSLPEKHVDNDPPESLNDASRNTPENGVDNNNRATPEPIPDTVRSIDAPSTEESLKIFDTIDYNGNGILSLAEIDKAVAETWPDVDNKPAIMRAYKASDRDGNGFIKRDEFGFFLKYIVYYNNYWTVFESTDVDGDRRLSKEEFISASSKLNVSNAEDVFEAMDTNNGGYVLFDEFCAHMAGRD